MRQYKRWFKDADGEVINYAEDTTDQIFYIYNSIADFYKIVYNLGMEYQNESDEQKNTGRNRKAVHMKNTEDALRESLRNEIIEMINYMDTIRYLRGIRDYATVPYKMEKEKRTSKTE